MSITVYTTPTCVYCKMVKAFLKEQSIDYSERDVASDDKAREEMIQKSGQLGVPVIDIDGKTIVGFDKQKLSELLGLKK